MKNLNHEYVLTFIGYIEVNAIPMFVVPYMGKGCLLDYIRDAQNEPKVVLLLRFAIDVAKGLYIYIL